MLDPRIYRAALLPIVLAVIVCAFSLGDRPRPIRTTLATDAFSEDRALQDLDDWVTAFPERRPGDPSDLALANQLADDFRALQTFQVSTTSFKSQTIDGERTLTTVVARQAGQSGPGLVVVAHRDAVGRGARAELSGTAAMLELARVVADGKLRRSITFVSTSGGTGGAAGARNLPRQLVGDTDAVLVLGNLASRAVRRPFVVGWSTHQGAASLQLRRTVETALGTEAGTNPGGARLASQWAHLAFPIATGEQGPLVAAGLPAVLLSVTGERAPPANAPITSGRLQAFGRAALRSLIALDNGPTLSAGTDRGLVTVRKVLPGWAVRLLVISLLLAPLAVAVDGLARLRRRGETLGPALLWLLASAVPCFVALFFTAFLGWTGLIAAAPPMAVAPGTIVRHGGGTAAMIAVGLILALGWVTLRPLILRARGPRARLRGAGAPLALVLVWCVLACLVWLFNPYQAALFVPGAHLLPIMVAPESRLRRGALLVLVGLTAAPFALVDLTHALALDAGPLEFAWLSMLLVAGGALGVGSWLVWSVVLACLVAALAMAWRPSRAPEITEHDVTMRGPLSYAGPGSLGGTESALRR